MSIQNLLAQKLSKQNSLRTHNDLSPQSDLSAIKAVRLPWLLPLLLLLALLPATLSAQITGRVVDSEGNALAGVHISALHDGAETTSDADGDFSLTLLENPVGALAHPAEMSATPGMSGVRLQRNPENWKIEVHSKSGVFDLQGRLLRGVESTRGFSDGDNAVLRRALAQAEALVFAKAGYVTKRVEISDDEVDLGDVVMYKTVDDGEHYTSVNIGELIYVPAGRLQRDATADNISIITQPYRMSQHEITRAQFLAVMGADPSNTSSSSSMNDPVQRVNWYHAIAFSNKLSLAEGFTPVYTVSGVDFATLTFADIPTSDNANWNAATADWSADGYRLPTEMEWMWAAMGAPADGQGGGTNTTGYTKAFAGHNGSNVIGDYAEYSVNSGYSTRPVGSKLPNELGLYDMSGNVWEWVWDWSISYPAGTLTDYRGAAAGTSRVKRGGSWSYGASFCTVAGRSYDSPNRQGNGVGFRVVRP
jgi:formylglycine-generating enzyme required for sulfatase activity